MTLFGGIDGGQTATLAVIGDANGRELGRGTGPAADLVGEARDATSQARALDAALDAALAAARLPAETPLGAVVAGISGYDAGISRPPTLRARATSLRVLHDAEIAHAGAFGDGAGIVAIAGTGSVALGNAAPGGPLVRAGGWGGFFGDEGSALALVRDALRRAMHAEDAGRSTRVAERARAFFGQPSLRAIQHAFAHGELDYAALAAFAPIVCALAADDRDDARVETMLAASGLYDTVRRLDARLGSVPVRRVAGVGGMFADAGFVRHFAGWCHAEPRVADGVVARASSRLAIVEPLGDPASGALRLARETPPA